MGKNLTPNCKSSLPDIVLNWVSQYHCQLVVEEDSLSCGPAKEDQHDVVEEGGHQATERPHGRHQTGHHKHHIQTEERHTDVDQNLPMLLPSKSPSELVKIHLSMCLSSINVLSYFELRKVRRNNERQRIEKLAPM